MIDILIVLLLSAAVAAMVALKLLLKLFFLELDADEDVVDGFEYKWLVMEIATVDGVAGEDDDINPNFMSSN